VFPLSDKLIAQKLDYNPIDLNSFLNERFIRDSDDPKDLGFKNNIIIDVFLVVDLKNTKIISKKIFRP
jgi:hypothetical protein